MYCAIKCYIHVIYILLDSILHDILLIVYYMQLYCLYNHLCYNYNYNYIVKFYFSLVPESVIRLLEIFQKRYL